MSWIRGAIIRFPHTKTVKIWLEWWFSWMAVLHDDPILILNADCRYWPHTRFKIANGINFRFLVLSTLVIYAWCTSYLFVRSLFRMAYFSYENNSNVETFALEYIYAAADSTTPQNTDTSHISIEWNHLKRNNAQRMLFLSSSFLSTQGIKCIKNLEIVPLRKYTFFGLSFWKTRERERERWVGIKFRFYSLQFNECIPGTMNNVLYNRLHNRFLSTKSKTQ